MQVKAVTLREWASSWDKEVRFEPWSCQCNRFLYAEWPIGFVVSCRCYRNFRLEAIKLVVSESETGVVHVYGTWASVEGGGFFGIDLEELFE